MLSITLFRSLFCLFRFNRKTEILCFGIEPKQPKQTFCFGQCQNQFRFQFPLFRIVTCFESKLVSKDTLASTLLDRNWEARLSPLYEINYKWNIKLMSAIIIWLFFLIFSKSNVLYVLQSLQPRSEAVRHEREISNAGR